MAATFDEVADAYLDNADFEETNSLVKARAFVTACVRLTVLLPSSASDQASSHSFDMAQIAADKARAQAFIAAGAQGASVRFLSVNGGGFR
jgi:hypothetical protein